MRFVFWINVLAPFLLNTDGFFSTSKNFKASISVPAKQIDTSCAEKEKVRRYICLTFSPSPISVTVTVWFKQWYHCQRERETERGGWKTDGVMGRREKGWEKKAVSELTPSIPPGLFICRCLHRELGCAEAPLTRFPSVSRSLWDASKAQSSMFARKSVRKYRQMMLCRERKFEDLFFRLRSPALDQSCSIRIQQIQGMEQTGIYKAFFQPY